jgi:hypothetical protein
VSHLRLPQRLARALLSPILLGAFGALLAAGPAAAQTMTDQELRLVEVHALLLALPPGAPPGALAAWELSAGVELIAIPKIDGTTGGKRQLTASDRTPLFPRPRLALGLPAPGDLRASIGVSYIPPLELAQVSSHFAAAELSLAWAPGPLAVGLRAYASAARSTSPVTDPATRDTLDTRELGADLSAAYRLDLGVASATPYAAAGLVHVSGDFTVESDGYLLASRTTRLALAAGLRVVTFRHLDATVEVASFPGRLVHPSLRLAWVSQL